MQERPIRSPRTPGRLPPALACGALLLAACASAGRPPPGPAAGGAPTRARARELGIEVGLLPPGRLNAITDVAGVRVGHATLRRGDDVRTGVTVVVPHGGDTFRERVPAAVCVGNGFGKAVGFTQVEELGELETPVALTSTLCTFRVADAIVSWVLSRPGNAGVRSVNPVVGETNDGLLNDGRGRHVGEEDVLRALRAAASGPVAEGCVGAGTGTRCLGFKGGIGTASRRLPARLGGYTLGALVQTNFGGILTINGAPVGRELGRHYLRDLVAPGRSGSCMIVLATDAPLSSRNLRRLARRALLAFGRVGAFSANGSGDYVIAFATHPDVRRDARAGLHHVDDLSNARMTPLFLAAIEATEEAILNSLFTATDTRGRDGSFVPALPLPRTLEILDHHRARRHDAECDRGP